MKIVTFTQNDNNLIVKTDYLYRLFELTQNPEFLTMIPSLNTLKDFWDKRAIKNREFPKEISEISAILRDIRMSIYSMYFNIKSSKNSVRSMHEKLRIDEMLSLNEHKLMHIMKLDSEMQNGIYQGKVEKNCIDDFTKVYIVRHLIDIYNFGIEIVNELMKKDAPHNLKFNNLNDDFGNKKSVKYQYNPTMMYENEFGLISEISNALNIAAQIAAMIIDDSMVVSTTKTTKHNENSHLIKTIYDGDSHLVETIGDYDIYMRYDGSYFVSNNKNYRLYNPIVFFNIETVREFINDGKLKYV